MYSPVRYYGACSRSLQIANVVDVEFLATDAELTKSRRLIDHVAGEFDLSHVVAAATAEEVDGYSIDRGAGDVREVADVDELVGDRQVEISAIFAKRQANFL